MNELKAAIEAAEESGRILNKYFNSNIEVEKKADNSPVTKADRESEMKIVSVLRTYFPDFPEYNILGEEFAYEKTDSNFKWIIDPLDMTKNFIRGIPFFSTFIALEKNNEIVTGVINMPAINTLAYASKGCGSFVNGRRVKVSNVPELSKAYIVYGDMDEDRTRPFARQISSLISSCGQNRGYGDALGYVLAAQGHIDIVLDNGKPWDVAPAKIIIEEAGGKVTDFEGKNTIYSGRQITTNGKLHDDALAILSAGK